ncbi:Lrp/AsnC family transcriptional regulator [Mangrovitalea sediminis]|uniref:Lrp/AsnC family transcriptional regulator n=1 Tax=Mangrovitalea sediminis TaxID=1982043 RepID=UPI000BE5FFA8|nr:Lrp/AsnC family transcriptional regulator [Mangrovitalea sediminis]
MKTAHVVELDRQDARILDALQDNARLSNVELSEIVHLSPSQCQRRRQRLEEMGIVQHYVAQLSPEKLGLTVMALMSVTFERHGEHIAQEFREHIVDYPEILECWSVTGDADYILKVVAADLKAFNDFMMYKLLSLPMVANVRSNLLLEALKSTTRLPVHYGR